MNLSAKDRAFLEATHSAAMITVGADGVPKAVRVGVVVVDGRLWSSGTADRVRTRRLRADPRCTLYVHDAGHGYLTLETTVRVLDGPDAPDLSLRLFRTMQNRPAGPLMWYGKTLDEDAFVAAMIDEKRLVYEFDIHRAYGMH
ncbi:pyridoxamine 5'-phosphate oxidase family protein [Microbacterium luticocti]|uniref:pyridoxamine 5'-phosphate oxidase family protein n=1 Tax=Microbacterium luticocti TaxID=451764 RepID=UPI0004278D13|nr:pyridoxamine 5'-phosphate oxidase family protein [Microbacterium luticocti]